MSPTEPSKRSDKELNVAIAMMILLCVILLGVFISALFDNFIIGFGIIAVAGLLSHLFFKSSLSKRNH